MKRPITYVLDGRKAIPAETLVWARWCETADRRVARTEIAPGVVVSTVFLGVDFNHSGRGEPILFESMILGGRLHGSGARAHTWEEAEELHAEVCARAKEGFN